MLLFTVPSTSHIKAAHADPCVLKFFFIILHFQWNEVSSFSFLSLLRPLQTLWHTFLAHQHFLGFFPSNLALDLVEVNGMNMGTQF